MSGFKFEFSLSTLNNLGRGLYRNFATVIAEAVSNAWDANASEVHIWIDSQSKRMTIQDNGDGMNEDDFQNRFLNVGYARREDPNMPTPKRKVLGRKGIGKLAMLSVSEKITIYSKKSGFDETGGKIDNAELDDRIKSNEIYELKALESEAVFNEGKTGTRLAFENIKPSMNRPQILMKYLAILFNFSFSFDGDPFDIYINGERISRENLSDLHDNTIFLWKIGDIEGAIEGWFRNVEEVDSITSLNFSHEEKIYEIKGYVAAVKKIGQIKVRGTSNDDGFKAGVHLFVNGRLRQENILDDLGGSNRLIDRYLYGEIHVDGFDDGDSNDIFTSSREGIIQDDPVYKEFLTALKTVQRRVVNNTDKWKEQRKKKALGEISEDLLPEKKEMFNKFMKAKDDDQVNPDYYIKAVKTAMPKRSKKKVLIGHSSANTDLADKIEEELLSRGINSSHILYTGSNREESKIPVDEDIYEYIRKFFVQDWYENPLVIFVSTQEMEESWNCALEVGAAWVTSSKHYIALGNGFKPQLPLNTGYLCVEFNENGDFANAENAKRIFDAIAKKIL